MPRTPPGTHLLANVYWMNNVKPIVSLLVHKWIVDKDIWNFLQHLLLTQSHLYRLRESGRTFKNGATIMIHNTVSFMIYTSWANHSMSFAIGPAILVCSPLKIQNSNPCRSRDIPGMDPMGSWASGRAPAQPPALPSLPSIPGFCSLSRCSKGSAPHAWSFPT